MVDDNGQRVAEAKPEVVTDRFTTPRTENVDPFTNLEGLRLNQDFATSLGVKKVLTVIPCRKPNRHEFVQVRPGKEWRLETATFEDKVARETYLVAPPLWSELAGEISPVCLFFTINRQNDVSLWPVKLPGADGKTNDWNMSALEAARLKKHGEVKLSKKFLDLFGVDRYATYRGLKQIEDDGLVTVERKPGCCPRVTINDVEELGEKEMK